MFMEVKLMSNERTTNKIPPLVRIPFLTISIYSFLNIKKATQPGLLPEG
jgi:hypothetical protein